MRRTKKPSSEAAELRRRAEARLKERTAEEAASRGNEDSRRLVHDLEVHQVELEMQNEELREARAESEARLERYTDLYDFAPVGYVTLGSDGTIRNANLTAARLLGVERSRLAGRRLGIFVSPEHRSSFAAFLQKVFESQVKEVCEVALDADKIPSPWVHIEAAASEDGGRECRAVLVDISERRRMEEALRFRLMLVDYAAAHCLEHLLRTALDAIGELTGSPVGFYHFVEPGQETLLFQAWSTQTVKEFHAAEGPGRRYPLDQTGLWADCVRQRRPLIRNDHGSLPHREGHSDGRVAVVRELVVPVLRADQIIAIVGVGNRSSDYTDQDVAIVSHLADVTWVIYERKVAENAREDSERRYREAAKALLEVDGNKT